MSFHQRFLKSLSEQRLTERVEGRRGFLKGLVLAAVVVPAVAFLEACKGDGEKGGETEAPPAGMARVNPEADATAKALGYHEIAGNVNLQQWPKRGGEEGAKQFCHTCNFYTAVSSGWGKCTLMPNGVVATDGWCNSWSPKAPS